VQEALQPWIVKDKGKLPAKADVPHTARELLTSGAVKKPVKRVVKADKTPGGTSAARAAVLTKKLKKSF
jgi:hypothetical protein